MAAARGLVEACAVEGHLAELRSALFLQSAASVARDAEARIFGNGRLPDAVPPPPPAAAARGGCSTPATPPGPASDASGATVSTAAFHTSLPRVFGWVGAGDARRRVKILLDSGASHCFVSRSLATSFGAAWARGHASGPFSVRPVGGVPLPLAGTLRVPLTLGTLREPTTFSVFDRHDLGVDADIILGYSWLAAHDLAFLYADAQVSFCAEAGCTSGRRVLLDVALPDAGRAPSAAAVIGSRALQRLLASRAAPAMAAAATGMTPAPVPLWVPPARSSTGFSKPFFAVDDHPTRPDAAPASAFFADGPEELPDGTLLDTGHFRIAEVDRLSAPSDAAPPEPAFEALAEEFADVLAGPPPGLPPDRGLEFELHINTGTAPMPRSRPMRRWSIGELEECRKQVNHLLDMGWIRPSTASHAASIVFARKADGTWRFCQDFRGLNAITARSVEPLPHVDQLVDETHGARFFTKLDLASAYHQFRIAEADQYKTSFRVPGGQYEFKVGAFGLHGMSSLLMRYMHRIFGRPVGPLGTGRDEAGAPLPSMLGSFVQVYMDDVLVFSRTKEEHLAHVRQVLTILRQHRLFAKASKCEFCRPSVAFLGHVISAAGVSMDPRKVSAIAELAQPASFTDVRRFIGLANYYRRFIDRFSEIAAPLTALGSPRASFHWGPAEQHSFDALKRALTSAPVLRVWDRHRKTVLTTDASELAVSAILSQPDDAGNLLPVAFESRKLTVAERAYPPHMLELLAVVHALRTFRHYLLPQGGPRPAGETHDFELHTDNQSIVWLQGQRTVSHHQARWLNTLAEFNFKVVHVPGSRNRADPLSRKRFPDGTAPAASTGYSDPGCDQELFAALAAAPPAFTPVTNSADPGGACHFLAPEFVAELCSLLSADAFFGPIMVGALASPGVVVDASGAPLPDPDARSRRRAYIARAGLLYRKGSLHRGDRLCVPAGGLVRLRVLRELHDCPLGGHFGRDKTMALVRRTVWWPNLEADVLAFLKSCPVCQRVKADHGGPKGLFFPLPVPARRGGTIGIDFVELPPSADGRDFLQVQMDLLTGRVWLVATRKTATAEDVARDFVASVFRDVGVPDCIVSDRDTRLTGKFWPALQAALGSTLLYGSPWHHNTNAKVERVNGVIADVLRSLVNARHDDWPSLLPLVEFAINDSLSALGTGFTPFYADRGQHPRRPLTPPPGDSAEPCTGADVASWMAQITSEVRSLLQESQARRKAAEDRRRRDVQFIPGDEVLLEAAHVSSPTLIRSKLAERWLGPFTITAVTAPNTYRLALPPKWRMFDEVNVDRLRRFHRRPPSLGGDLVAPPPVVGADGREEHEVEEILQFKRRRGQPVFLVRWVGMDRTHDQWVPLTDMTNCEEAFLAFEERSGVPLPRPPPSHNPGPPPSAPPASPPPPFAPAGFRLAAPEELRLGHRLVRSHILFYWPSDGWLRGRVTECRRRGQFTHVVSYPRDSPAAGKCSTLLDAESHGPDGRWVLLLPSHAPPP